MELTLRREFPTPAIVGAHVFQLKNHETIALHQVHHVRGAAERGLPLALGVFHLVISICEPCRLRNTQSECSDPLLAPVHLNKVCRVYSATELALSTPTSGRKL